MAFFCPFVFCFDEQLINKKVNMISIRTNILAVYKFTNLLQH